MHPIKAAEKAQREIQRLISEAYASIRRAEELALEHKVSFSLDVAYGMGGTFIGDPEEGSTMGYGPEKTGWYASSHSC